MNLVYRLQIYLFPEIQKVIYFLLRRISSAVPGKAAFYSFLNALTGFPEAALKLCQLTVNNVIPTTINRDIIYVQTLKLAR